MARPYQEEIDRLSETFNWVESLDLYEIVKTIRASSKSGLYAIGSGGSLSAAVALADLHSYWTTNMSKAITTFQSSNITSVEKQIFWLISASGNNVDINTSFEHLTQLTPQKIAILTCRQDSKLMSSITTYPLTESFVFTPPVGKDGFLATNSLLAFVAILTRAYCEAFCDINTWNQISLFIKNILLSDSNIYKWEKEIKSLLHRDTLIIIYGDGTNLGAFDLESKFVEAALGNIQISDLRNFAHGRHHWLAKRGDTSAILAIYSTDDKNLAEKTLNLIPKDIPIGRIFFETTKTVTPLASLLLALYTTKWAGEMRRIDPGKPGVPDFGRRLYHLSPHNKKRKNTKDQIAIKDQTAIEKKTGYSFHQLKAYGTLEFWQKKLFDFKTSLVNTKFSGIIFDYDGTIVDTPYRLNPPSEDLIAPIINLLEAGIHVGFATGRGKSIRIDLQKVIPEKFWKDILIGYYNGADVSFLNDNIVPQKGPCIEELKNIKINLDNDVYINRKFEIEYRKNQITINSKLNLSGDDMFYMVFNSINPSNIDNIKIYSSDHSVDIMHRLTTKNSVLYELKKIYKINNDILIIGDKGRWPGNDYELLSNPFSLSVNSVNSFPDTCWNLGEPGCIGANLTKKYLYQISIARSYFQIDLDAKYE